MAPFEFETNPEFPGTGEWGCATFAFSAGSRGMTVEGGGYVYDGPAADMVVRVTGALGRWVGFFAGGLGGVTRAMRSPDPHRLLVLVEGEGYLVPVASPRETERVTGRMPIRAIIATEDSRILLLASWIDVTALGDNGTLWRSRRLCLDDLKIDKVGDNRVQCRGIFEDTSEASITLDLETGEQIAGRVLPDPLQ